MKMMSLAKTGMLYLTVLAVVVMTVFPIAWIVMTSVKLPQEVYAKPPQWIPSAITLDNFKKTFLTSKLNRSIYNSLIVGFGTVGLTMLVSIFAGYAISRYRFPGRHPYRLLLLVTRMFPPFLIIVPLFLMIKSIGLYDTRFALILTHTAMAIPVAVWMLATYFDTIPKELEEAAAIDGCGKISSLFRIVLPLSAPGITSVALYIFILSWDEFLFAFILTSSEAARTLPVGIAIFVGEYWVEWGELMAASVIALLPAVLITIVVNRYLVSGLLAGGVKQ